MADVLALCVVLVKEENLVLVTNKKAFCGGRTAEFMAEMICGGAGLCAGWNARA